MTEHLKKAIGAIFSILKPKKRESQLISGVVESVGGGAKDGDWFLNVFISPWRDQSGAVNKSSLRLTSELPIKKSDIQLAKERYVKGSAWIFSVVEHEGWIELVEIGDQVADSDFDKTSENWNRPLIVEDQILGKLALDRKRNWYEGNWTSGDMVCSLHVLRSGQGDQEDLFRAREPALWLNEHSHQIQNAVAQLVDLYNETWRDECPRLSREEFLGKVSLVSITIHPNEETVLYFDSEELFLDHGIEVRLDGSRNLTTGLS